MLRSTALAYALRQARESHVPRMIKRTGEFELRDAVYYRSTDAPTYIVTTSHTRSEISSVTFDIDQAIYRAVHGDLNTALQP